MTRSINAADLDHVRGGVTRIEYTGGSGSANAWKPADDGAGDSDAK